jgi:hypothetical protein
MATFDDVVRNVLESPGALAPDVRRSIAAGQPPAELAAYTAKVARCAYRVTDADVAALRERFSEDEILEATLAAAVGAAAAGRAAALAALGGRR